MPKIGRKMVLDALNNNEENGILMTENRFFDFAIVFSMIDLVSVPILRQIRDTLFLVIPRSKLIKTAS